MDADLKKLDKNSEKDYLIPRQRRLDAPGAFHHGMGRGVERIKLFGTRFRARGSSMRLNPNGFGVARGLLTESGGKEVKEAERGERFHSNTIWV